MDTKEQLISHIKEWVRVDNEETRIRSLLRQTTKAKKDLTEQLVAVMKKNEIDCFNINDGALFYKASKSKKPISGKFLLAALQKYYKSDPQKAEDITNYVLENREEQVRETIRRKIDRPSGTEDMSDDDD